LDPGERFVNDRGSTDDAVARFYEDHPYPPPADDLGPTIEGWRDGRRRRIEHYRTWPTIPYRDDHTILVAGCGTSQAAKYAARYPAARVVGIDVSDSSLNHARELADRFGLDNLELRRLAVEAVGELDTPFDHIVCTGVLHHLADPGAGLRALRHVLAPEGAMYLMLYATYGRTGVYMLQDYARLLDIRPSAEGIDALVASLRELPLGHPLRHLLRNTPDFEDPDALADALLHPRDRAYSVTEIHELLAAAELRFGRWIRQAPYLPGCGVLRSLPHGPQISALPTVRQHAALELFRGTMTRHSFTCHHSDDATGAIDFEGDRWPGYVPIRTATAMTVDRNLPSGAAAALLNQAHTYPDLVMLVNEREKQWFERIDGRRSISEISDDRRFFEQLWWQDLIVLDASKAAQDGAQPS